MDSQNGFKQALEDIKKDLNHRSRFVCLSGSTASAGGIWPGRKINDYVINENKLEVKALCARDGDPLQHDCELSIGNRKDNFFLHPYFVFQSTLTNLEKLFITKN